jgi:hypothetical protein
MKVSRALHSVENNMLVHTLVRENEVQVHVTTVPPQRKAYVDVLQDGGTLYGDSGGESYARGKVYEQHQGCRRPRPKFGPTTCEIMIEDADEGIIVSECTTDPRR